MITREMTEFFHARTHMHIKLVNKFAKVLQVSLGGDACKKLSFDFSAHDKDKFEKPLYLPYVYLSWKYHKPSFEYPEGVEQAVNIATLLHIVTNPHHPEFWDKSNAGVNKEDRDEPASKIINAYTMSDQALLEFVCDCSAVGWEREEKSARSWFDKNIGSRWNFTKNQTKQIYAYVEIIEKALS